MRMEVLEKSLIEEAVDSNSLTYEKYYQLIKQLLEEGKTTGQYQKESYLQHARLNFQRMKRVFRTTVISRELKETISKINQEQLWLVISEGWCGDAAQNLPAIAKLAELNDHIELKVLLRDQNIEVMDAYLTNGTRSIPKLIAIDKKTKAEIFTWGPRPKHFQNMVIQHKKNPQVPNEEFNKLLHKEYSLDKTVSIQKEILGLMLNNSN